MCLYCLSFFDIPWQLITCTVICTIVICNPVMPVWNFVWSTHVETEYGMESDGEIETDIQQSVSPSLPLDSPPNQEEQETKAVVWWIVAYVSLFQSLHFIPDRAISWRFKFLYVLLKYCCRFSSRIMQIEEDLPHSLYLRGKNLQCLSNSKEICRCCLLFQPFPKLLWTMCWKKWNPDLI